MSKSRSRRPVRHAPVASDAARTYSRGTTAIVLLLFASVFITESVFSYTQKSATWDEPIHVADGYASLFRQDYRFDPEHPPFLRMYAALPLASVPRVSLDLSVIDQTLPETWATQTLFNQAHRFMYLANDADRLLYRARFMVVLLGLLLGTLIFCWTREWLGFAPAAIALALFTFEPNTMAHFSLVTTDAPLTCFAFGAVYFLWRTVRQRTGVNVAGLIVFCALAVVTKFTAVLLAPIIIALLLLAAFWQPGFTFSSACAIAVTLFVASWVAIWAVYEFRYAPSDSSTWLYRFQDSPWVVERVPSVSTVVGWVDRHHLLPNVFAQGFLLGQAKAQVRTAFLAGAYSETGWWYFFPVALLIKTPVPLLLMSLAGLIHAKPLRLRKDLTPAFVMVPIAVFLGVAMASHINVGLRHVLTIYPFIIMLAAVAAKVLLARKGRSGVLVLSALALVWAIELGRTYPHTLAFFNTFVGGPDHGAEYLVDSNLDWGQDLKPLKRWMDDHDVTDINLAYFGLADPAYYGIRCTYLGGSPPFVPAAEAPHLPGYVAVSVTLLTGTYANADESHRRYYWPLLARTPVTSIGHSINVYWVDSSW